LGEKPLKGLTSIKDMTRANKRIILAKSSSHRTVKGNLVFNACIDKEKLESLIKETEEEKIYLQAHIEDEEEMELSVDDFEFVW